MMQYLTYYLLAATVVLFLIASVLYLALRGSRQTLDITIAELRLVSNANDRAVEGEKLAQEEVTFFQDQVDACKLEHEAELKALTLKAEAALSANMAFQTSRDQVWDMYRKGSLASGAAQAWLFRELNNAIRTINQYRTEKGESPIAAPSGLEEVITDFKDEHMDPNKKVPGA